MHLIRFCVEYLMTEFFSATGPLISLANAIASAAFRTKRFTGSAQTITGQKPLFDAPSLSIPFAFLSSNLTLLLSIPGGHCGEFRAWRLAHFRIFDITAYRLHAR